MEGAGNDVSYDERKRFFVEFLDTWDGGKYVEKLRETMTDGRYRLIVGLNDLRDNNAADAAELIRNPREYMIALQDAAKEVAESSDPSTEKLLQRYDLQVGFEDSLGENAVTPRGLVSSLLNKMVVVEGIVTKCSNVRPKLVKSVQYCPATLKYSSKEYRDNTALDLGIDRDGKNRLPTPAVLPTKDDENNALEMEHGLCQYKDYQTLVLQEMPERSQVGQLPRTVDVILEHDLVDRVKPGDRVQCVGVYRPLGSSGLSRNGSSSGVFKTSLIGNNISIIGKEIGSVKLTGLDVGNIKAVANRPDILGLLSGSLAPSIFGMEHIKKALILQLLGGCERNLENGTHLRGDINVMMVGDPSTAKSQLLRSIIDIAPLAISTTGRGSSGVGLTAAVTSDQETGERRLEAGATVLADRGIVCVDEFDKMSENDRVAIHEVMEQQTVTIAKGGIHASLNARCSVLAAANPIYGQYDRTRRPQENIGLPDSLLSRFDLLFIVLDQLDPVSDRRLSEHVLRSHQYRKPGTIMEPEPLYSTSFFTLDDPADQSKNTSVWNRGGNAAQIHSGASDFLTKDFLRKYMHYAKNKAKPTLTEIAMTNISDAYTQMRAKQTRQNLPVTARSLETLIRLSSAHAKARLSSTVEELDVEVAVDLVNFVLYGEISSPHDEIRETTTAAEVTTLTGKKRSKKSREIEGTTSDDQDDDDEDDVRGEIPITYNDKSTASKISKSLDKFETIISILNDIREQQEGDDAVISISDLMQRLSSSMVSSLNEDEVRQTLHEMEKNNKIMMDNDDNQIHLI